MTGEENYVEHALEVGEALTGLTLEQLGFEPRLEDLRRISGAAWTLMTSNGRAQSPRGGATGACSRQSSWPAPYGRPPPS